MSEVQALLAVDAGRTPPGAVAFFPRDPDAPARKVFAFAAVIVDGGALALAIAGIALAGAALLGLIGVAFALAALPTKPDYEDDQAIKRPTLVLTEHGMIVRDAEGLRSWQFDELIEVCPFVHLQSLGLLLVRKDGRRDFVDTQFFERGEKVRDLVRHRFKPREA